MISSKGKNAGSHPKTPNPSPERYTDQVTRGFANQYQRMRPELFAKRNRGGSSGSDRRTRDPSSLYRELKTRVLNPQWAAGIPRITRNGHQSQMCVLVADRTPATTRPTTTEATSAIIRNVMT